MSESGGANLLTLIRRAMELAMPDLRHYYRTTRKARVVASYASDGKYYADVQPLRNDDTPDPAEPVIPKVEIPILWGGPKRGVVCPPDVGTHCDLSYYDGDPNYPRLSNFRWLEHDAPECELTELIIQQEPGVSIKIDREHKVITITPTEINAEAGQKWTVRAGAEAIIEASQIRLIGNVTSGGPAGGAASFHQTGPQTIVGPVTIKGPLTVTGGITGKVNGCSGC